MSSADEQPSGSSELLDAGLLPEISTCAAFQTLPVPTDSR